MPLSKLCTLRVTDASSHRFVGGAWWTNTVSLLLLSPLPRLSNAAVEVIIRGWGQEGRGGLLIWAAPVQWAEKDIRLIMSLQGESCQRRVANRVAPLIPEAAAAASDDDDDDDDDAAAELLRRRCAFFFGERGFKPSQRIHDKLSQSGAELIPSLGVQRSGASSENRAKRAEGRSGKQQQQQQLPGC